MFIRRLIVLCGAGSIAKACGKERQTVDAWARPVVSNETPTGTGKHNPFDCVVRLQGLAHEEGDAGLAREIAEMFTDHVNALDKVQVRREGCLNGLIGSAVKEHGDYIVELLNSVKPDFARAYTEIVQAEVALRKLKLFVKDELAPEK